jgi:hypothetical protein
MFCGRFANRPYTPFSESARAMIEKGKVVETKMMKAGEAAAKAMGVMIRQSSEAGQLISESEILRRVADQQFSNSPAANGPEEARKILKKVIEESEDLNELTAQDGSPRYYSSRCMTEAYAMILLRKQGDSLRLIAEIVRQNSEVYPRPVPLDLFTQPPFDLTRQEVLNHLERMAAEEEYRDIVPTTTSASRMFLYSTRYLESEHASMLAEWLDVGQSNNP